MPYLLCSKHLNNKKFRIKFYPWFLKKFAKTRQEKGGLTYDFLEGGNLVAPGALLHAAPGFRPPGSGAFRPAEKTGLISSHIGEKPKAGSNMALPFL